MSTLATDLPFREGVEYTRDVSNVFPLQPREKLVVVTELHGHMKKTTDFLIFTNLMNKKYEWIGKGENVTTLVVMGNFCGPEHDSKDVIELLLHLKEQANTLGGRVIILAGDNEVKVALGDFSHLADIDGILIGGNFVEGINLSNYLPRRFQDFLMHLPIECVVGNVACSYNGIIENQQSINYTNDQFFLNMKTLWSVRSKKFNNLKASDIYSYDSEFLRSKYPYIYSYLNPQIDPELESEGNLSGLKWSHVVFSSYGYYSGKTYIDATKNSLGELLLCLDYRMGTSFTPEQNFETCNFFYSRKNEHRFVRCPFEDEAEVRFIKDFQKFGYYKTKNARYTQQIVDNGVIEVPFETTHVKYGNVIRKFKDSTMFLNGVVFRRLSR